MVEMTWLDARRSEFKRRSWLSHLKKNVVRQASWFLHLSPAPALQLRGRGNRRDSLPRLNLDTRGRRVLEAAGQLDVTA